MDRSVVITAQNIIRWINKKQLTYKCRNELTITYKLNGISYKLLDLN